MNAIRTIQEVTEPTLTIAVPAEILGKQFEIIVSPVENTALLPPELDPRYARFIMPKPPLSEEQKKELEQNPYPLRGTGGEYIDPFLSLPFPRRIGKYTARMERGLPMILLDTHIWYWN